MPNETPVDLASLNISQLLVPLLESVELLVDKTAREHMGIALLVFKMGDPAVHGQRAQYVSNVPREVMVAALTELLERWKAGGDRGPLHLPEQERH